MSTIEERKADRTATTLRMILHNLTDASVDASVTRHELRYSTTYVSRDLRDTAREVDVSTAEILPVVREMLTTYIMTGEPGVNTMSRHVATMRHPTSRDRLFTIRDTLIALLQGEYDAYMVLLTRA